MDPPGVLRRSDALTRLSRQQVSRRIASGRWTVLGRSLYWTRAGPVPFTTRCWVACAAGPSGAVVSHQTAAALHGLWVPGYGDTGPIHQIALTGAGSADRVVHRVATLPPWEMRDGVRVTTVAKTLGDLLLDSDRLQAVCAVERARQIHRDLSAGVVLGTLGGRPGCRRARDWLALADGRSESPLETLLRLVVVDAGLPPPVPQLRVYVGRRPIARLDLAWPDCRAGLEADGAAVHAQPDALFRDRRRQNALVNAGWLLLRFTWADAMTHPGGVARAVAAALDLHRVPQAARRLV
jgi:hypothetical protein